MDTNRSAIRHPPTGGGGGGATPAQE